MNCDTCDKENIERIVGYGRGNWCSLDCLARSPWGQELALRMKEKQLCDSFMNKPFIKYGEPR